MTEVVAALIWKEDTFLICQRGRNKSRGLLWEFVGGKVEKGETKEQALIRECKEELNVDLSVKREFMDTIHHYPDMDVHLTVYISEIVGGTLTKIEHEDMKWIKVNEVDSFEFCPPDIVILNKIKETFH